MAEVSDLNYIINRFSRNIYSDKINPIGLKSFSADKKAIMLLSSRECFQEILVSSGGDIQGGTIIKDHLVSFGTVI